MSKTIIDRMCALLRSGKLSARDLASKIGCAESASRRNLYTPRRIGAVHISHYRTIRYGQQEAIYAYGEGQDAPPPDAIVRRQRAKIDAALPKPIVLGPWGCVW